MRGCRCSWMAAETSLLVDLGSGAVQHIAGDEFTSYQRPVLSADGRVLIAEGFGNLFRFDLQ